MAGKRIIAAAGGIVWRPRRTDDSASDGIEILLVHRPGYNDWTFPKGKRDPGEPLQMTAVREISEETQLTVRLGHPLSRVDYRVSSGHKQVHYWMAQLAEADPAQFRPNREVDELRWVKPRRAAQMLSYRHDRKLLDEFRALRNRKVHKAQPLILLRHASATSRRSFTSGDDQRPLTKPGLKQASALVPLLSAYAPTELHSSPAIRCQQTIGAYAKYAGRDITIDSRLGEDASDGKLKKAVRDAMELGAPTVLCSHLPSLAAAMRVLTLPPIDFKPSDGVVVYHRKGKVIGSEPLHLLNPSRVR